MSETGGYTSAPWTTPCCGPSMQRHSFDGDTLGSSPAESTSSLFAAMSLFGTSPDTPLQPFFPTALRHAKGPVMDVCTAAADSKHPSSSAGPTVSAAAASTSDPISTVSSVCDGNGSGSFLQLSLGTLLGCCEMLGHHMEDRSDIARQQDMSLLAQLQEGSGTPLRDETQRPLFVVAPLDVLVTRDAAGGNRFHVIEINGTGISGLTNMSDGAVEDVLRSFSELAAHLTHPDVLVLVASSGQETYPPVSRTLHEKMLYVEALKRGFEAAGRRINVTNMSRLEKRPESMPPSGPTVVLGYMKQFRANFMMDPASGRLMLYGRQVHAAINDRFVLNTVYQFDHRLDLSAFRGYNAGYAAGADKGIAYDLYNQFFGSEELGGRFPCMASVINFRRARTRTELIAAIQTWTQCTSRPAVIKPQGTGCGHGIEFFFGRPSWTETAAKVDRALHSVASNYNLQCGGLPYTVCEYLDTATIAMPSTSSSSSLTANTTAAATPASTSTGGSCSSTTSASSCGSETTADDVSAAFDHQPAVSTTIAGSVPAAAAAATHLGAPPPLPLPTCPSPHSSFKAGHKFELRVVVYRTGSELRAFPSIAKVAREPYDPHNPDNKKSLINNITTSAKETAQSGQEFLLPLCSRPTLTALGISPSELAQLCAACTAFMRFVVDRVQDDPLLFGLPPGASV